MIVGRGLLANSLKFRDETSYLFYANGISNSVIDQIPSNNFEINEITDIAETIGERTFIYFSTSQVNSKTNLNRPYVKHKLFIENLIVSRFSKYLIIRTSNLVGNNLWNEHTLFNFLFNSLLLNQKITINPLVTRNFLDVSDFVILLQTYLKNYHSNKIIEIVNPISFTMDQIINEFENYFEKKFIKKTGSEIIEFALFELDTELSLELFARCNISTHHYIPNLLSKYYVDK